MEDLQDRPPHEALFGLMMGAWITQAVGTLARLRIPDAVAGGAATAPEVAAELALQPDATYRLMRACAAAGIFTRLDEQRFALSPVGELLRSGVPGSMRALFDAETAPGHWLPWGKLDERVRGGEVQTVPTLGMDLWEYYRQNPGEQRDFADGMTGLSASSVAAVLGAYEFGDPRKVVDVGGSHGVFLAGVLGRHPEARGILFDMPQIVAEAGETLERLGVAERVERQGGDFLASVPAGDLYLLKFILHDWDDASCIRILANCRAAMADGGKVVVTEMLIGGLADPPSPAPFLDLNMMVLMPGRERTVAEFAALFAAAGLKLAQVVPTGSPFFVLEAVAA